MTKQKDLIAALTLETILSEQEDNEPIRDVEQLECEDDIVRLTVDMKQGELDALRRACHDLKARYAMKFGEDEEDLDLADCIEWISEYFMETWEPRWEDDEEEKVEEETPKEKTERLKKCHQVVKEYSLRFWGDDGFQQSMPPIEKKAEDGPRFPAISDEDGDEDRERESKFMTLKGRVDTGLGEQYHIDWSDSCDRTVEATLEHVRKKTHIQEQMERFAREYVKATKRRRMEVTDPEDPDVTEYFNRVYNLDKRPIYGGKLKGEVNGSNTKFETQYNIEFGQEKVYLNGLRQEEDLDYYASGPNEITFTQPPMRGDRIVIDYL